MYKSEWTDDPVLHIFPHWNWNEGDTIDVWAYTNCDEVELFLNGKSEGIKQNGPEKFRLVWRLVYEPGEIKAVGRNNDIEVLTTEVKTAGEPYKISLKPDREEISADGRDLCFITIDILDEHGTLIPHANNLVRFSIKGEGSISAVDNGSQTSHEPFKADYRKAFNGKCLVVVRSGEVAGNITLTASSDGLEEASVQINTY